LIRAVFGAALLLFSYQAIAQEKPPEPNHGVGDYMAAMYMCAEADILDAILGESMVSRDAGNLMLRQFISIGACIWPGQPFKIRLMERGKFYRDADGLEGYVWKVLTGDLEGYLWVPISISPLQPAGLSV